MRMHQLNPFRSHYLCKLLPYQFVLLISQYQQELVLDVASEGEVLKNHPPSSRVLRAGDVADGEIATTPLGTSTLVITAPVLPEQLGPIIAITFSSLIRRSASAIATAASIQTESP